MVLHVGDEHDRSVLIGDLQKGLDLFRNTNAYDALQLVDDIGHARPGSNEYVVGARVDVALDDVARVAVGAGHGGARHTRLRVGVTHEGTNDIREPFFDGSIQATARNPVRVDDGLLSVGAREGLPDTYDLTAERLKILLKRRHGGPGRLTGSMDAKQTGMAGAYLQVERSKYGIPGHQDRTISLRRRATGIPCCSRYLVTVRRAIRKPFFSSMSAIR